MQLLTILVTCLNVGRGKVLEGELDDDFPSRVYLYDKTEHMYKGSQANIPEIKVVKAGTKDTGCFLLYEKEDFDCLKHKVDWATKPLLEEITVRSIKFLPKGCPDVFEEVPEDCSKSRGAVVSTSIGLVLTFLVLAL